MTWLDTVMDFSSPRMSYEKNDLMQLRKEMEVELQTVDTVWSEVGMNSEDSSD